MNLGPTKTYTKRQFDTDVTAQPSVKSFLCLQPVASSSLEDIKKRKYLVHEPSCVLPPITAHILTETIVYKTIQSWFLVNLL